MLCGKTQTSSTLSQKEKEKVLEKIDSECEEALETALPIYLTYDLLLHAQEWSKLKRNLKKLFQ